MHSGPERGRLAPSRLGLAFGVLIVAVLAASSAQPAVAAREGDVQLRITGAFPSSWDPALQGDAASASTLAQVFEGLTALDANAVVQPALAESWLIEDEGRRITFRLRPDIRYSDGSPITADDVVSSWLRLIDPERRSPLASLLDDVVGAAQYGRGEGAADGVGLRAEGDRVVVELQRAASYFLSVTSSPSLAVVPTDGVEALAGAELPAGMVVSGAYVPTEQTLTGIRLEANEAYWAGPAPLRTIELVADLEGRSPVESFENGEIDYTQISSSDASWLRYDETLGPQLRQIDSLSVDYYGFDTSSPPFDDARVRRAFVHAVDWDRLVRLGNATAEPASSLVPPGIAGRSENDFSPAYDPDAARDLLAEAGYPRGEGFPEVTLTTSGYGTDEAIAQEVETVLGVELAVEQMGFEAYFERLDDDPPAFWALSWIADYPAPHDFLGLLLGSGSGNNYGGWSNQAFDEAIATAAETVDVADQERAYDAAQEIVREEVPVIPLSYGESWALSHRELLGANEAGTGIVRFAGLDWADR